MHFSRIQSIDFFQLNVLRKCMPLQNFYLVVLAFDLRKAEVQENGPLLLILSPHLMYTVLYSVQYCEEAYQLKLYN